MATSIIGNGKNVFTMKVGDEPNLNWIHRGGVYSYGPSSVGKPSSYGAVLHIGSSTEATGWHWQLAFSTENRVYVRDNINATPSDFGGNWTAWREL